MTHAGPSGGEPVGTFCLVLHTHLPWLAHAGTWPVGEEWLHQAWSAAYQPVVDVLQRLAAEGRRDLLTLGMTPVLNAMLDDPYLLREHHTWLGYWQQRAVEAAARPGADALRAVAHDEHRRATAALGRFEREWRHGGSPVLRALSDSGAVELLGGPATHPCQPLLRPRVADAQLGIGLDDAALRLGRRPEGIWAPECAYEPGLEARYSAHGVRRFVIDGPTLLGSVDDPHATGAPWDVAGSGVLAYARDLEVSYRVWSPRAGYPGGAWYRDFHSFDHPTGLRPFRVTGRSVPVEGKRWYDPARAAAAVDADARAFVDVVRTRLLALRAARGVPSLVVAAFDTELFGHWWLEGPQWLEAVLRLLPDAGVRVSTLGSAVDHVDVAGSVDLRPGTWGSGKDLRVWTGEAVAPMVAESTAVQDRLLALVDARPAAAAARPVRDPAWDQLLREALLVTSSDWAFCVTKDSAADYARHRHAQHRDRFHALADCLSSGDAPATARLVDELCAVDGLLGHLDARRLSADS